MNCRCRFSCRNGKYPTIGRPRGPGGKGGTSLLVFLSIHTVDSMKTVAKRAIPAKGSIFLLLLDYEMCPGFDKNGVFIENSDYFQLIRTAN